jgi:hypothetical protein
MFNPEKDFNRKVIETLGKDGKSISALSKELESQGIKHHRLILTGYLRALTDINMLKEKDVPPSKIYIPIKSGNDTIYQSVERSVRKISDQPNETILYVLYRLFKRPIFESELKLAGVSRVNAKPVDGQMIAECKKVMKRNGNIIPTELAYEPTFEYPEIYSDVLSDILLESKDSKHLVMETKQTKLI